MAAAGGERLIGWKAIGNFLGCDARTARRWEVERGLPVHRVPGGGRAAVWAEPHSLRQWLTSSPRSGIEAAAAARPRWPTYAFVVGAAAGLAILATFLVRMDDRDATARAAPFAGDSLAQQQYRRGMLAWNSRTPAGIATAIEEFEALARLHPNDGELLSRLAESYLLSREFGSVPDKVAYERAEHYATRALAADAKSAAALRSLGFVRFWGYGDPGGIELFARAVRAEPASALTRHWYANALLYRGRIDEARREFAAARALDPVSPALAADEALLLLIDDRGFEARHELERLLALDPRSIPVLNSLAYTLLHLGDAPGYLDAAAAAHRLRGDRQGIARIEEARRVLAERGEQAMWLRLAELEEAAPRANWLLDIACLRALGGDLEGARARIETAERRKDPGLVSLPSDVIARRLARH